MSLGLMTEHLAECHRDSIFTAGVFHKRKFLLILFNDLLEPVSQDQGSPWVYSSGENIS